MLNRPLHPFQRKGIRPTRTPWVPWSPGTPGATGLRTTAKQTSSTLQLLGHTSSARRSERSFNLSLASNPASSLFFSPLVVLSVKTKRGVSRLIDTTIHDPCAILPTWGRISENPSLSNSSPTENVKTFQTNSF